MATTTGLLSWEAFEQFPDDGMHHELIEGEVQVLPPPKSTHSRIAKRIFLELLSAESNAAGEALFEAGFKLSTNPASWIQPDVSFVLNEQLNSTGENNYFLGSPALAVEVVSPSETARDLQRKIDLLLANGSLAVWVIYPETQVVKVNLPDGTTHTRGMNDTLALPALLPDWQLPVAKLFEE
jgi:Uma2 family endonuclease